MDWVNLSWKQVAIIAAAAVAVIAIGFLSSNTGPVQGGKGGVFLYHSDVECYIKMELHFGDIETENSGWVLYSGKDGCLVGRGSSKALTLGREAISRTIKAAKK